MTQTSPAEIRVAGLLVHANAARAEAVRAAMEAMTGVEVAAMTENHRFVVVCEERPDGPRLADAITALDKIQGVLNASLVYEHTEPA